MLPNYQLNLSLSLSENGSISTKNLSAMAVGIFVRLAEHNRAMQAMTGRPRGAIEYKHQNISAVLKGLNEDWIPGYKPAFNFQLSLADAVDRWLRLHPDWLARPAHTAAAGSRPALQEDALLWIGPPPDLQQCAAAGRARTDAGGC